MHDGPTTPFAKNGNDRGHIWRREPDGKVDDFALEVDPHNGPQCVRCGYTYCIHCDQGPDEDCPGRDDFRPTDREKARKAVGQLATLLRGTITWSPDDD